MLSNNNNQNTNLKDSPVISPINSPSLSPTLISPPTSPSREGNKSPVNEFKSPRNSPSNSPRLRNSPQGNNNSHKLEPSPDYKAIIEPYIQIELESIKNNHIKNFGDSLSSLLQKESEILSIIQSELQSRKGHNIPITVVQIIEFLRCYGGSFSNSILIFICKFYLFYFDQNNNKYEGLREPGLFRVCGKHTELVLLQKQVEDGFCLGFEDMRSINFISSRSIEEDIK